jgi:hypothetical protein
MSRQYVVADNFYKHTLLPTLSLFTSVGTLICCALPALLVTLGMGAALAGLVTNAPWLVAISEYKAVVFISAGILLATAVVFQYRARYAPCPTDPAKAAACARLRKFSVVVLAVSILIYAIGFFFAFIAARIFYG